MDWFRAYAEMIDDPKVWMQLSDSQFRIWMGVLCLATKADADGDTLQTVEQVSWSLRRSVEEEIAALVRLGLVSITKQKTVFVTNFSKRQKRSDNSTERVKKHRGKQGVKQSETVTETFHETEVQRPSNALDQIRSDQRRIEENRSPKPPSGETGLTDEDAKRLTEAFGGKVLDLGEFVFQVARAIHQSQSARVAEAWDAFPSPKRADWLIEAFRLAGEHRAKKRVPYVAAIIGGAILEGTDLCAKHQEPEEPPADPRREPGWLPNRDAEADLMGLRNRLIRTMKGEGKTHDEACEAAYTWEPEAMKAFLDEREGGSRGVA